MSRSRCCIKSLDADMTGSRRYDTTPRETGQGRPDGVRLATLAERHPLCGCSWVWDAAAGKFRLKYQNTACLAVYWHRTLAG